jgi:pimeloyl-[acyl-carrier protein] methyl ester esterase
MLADEWVERWPGAVWVGWSLGGQVALAAAARAPGRVRALVPVGATPCFVERPGWSGGMAPRDFDDFLARCAADPDATRARFLALTMRGDTAGRDGLRKLRALDSGAASPDHDALFDGLRVLATTDLVDALPTIRCPTLWLAGDRDAVVPPAASMAGARSQPRARVSCLPGAGHAPFLTHGREVIEHTQNWLKETRA